ncbi:unnamed protein product [Mycena citricolor]|uniref:Uncharacterized protein n=1 Tax=Mycena citricolor TaxID=2018698 RepID=A0AAD2Q729_9AGAR|nr:unnamed protein product [Mycena citricolor]
MGGRHGRLGCPGSRFNEGLSRVRMRRGEKPSRQNHSKMWSSRSRTRTRGLTTWGASCYLRYHTYGVATRSPPICTDCAPRSDRLLETRE